MEESYVDDSEIFYCTLAGSSHRSTDNPRVEREISGDTARAEEESYLGNSKIFCHTVASSSHTSGVEREISSRDTARAEETNEKEKLPVAHQELEKDPLFTVLDKRIQNLEDTMEETATKLGKLQSDFEQLEALSQTAIMLYQEVSEEIRNLQSGFHEIGRKSCDWEKNKDQLEKTIKEEVGKIQNMKDEHDAKLRELEKKEEDKLRNMKEDFYSKIQVLEKEVQCLKGKQSSVITEAMRSTLECMVCLESPCLPLFVCSNCSKMIGCFQCCAALTVCANCRGSLPEKKQPLRGLEVLSLILKTSDEHLG